MSVNVLTRQKSARPRTRAATGRILANRHSSASSASDVRRREGATG